MFRSRVQLVLWCLVGCVLAGVGVVWGDPAIGGSVFAATITRALVPPKRDGLLLGARYGPFQPEIIVNRAPSSTVAPQRDSVGGVAPGGYSYDVPATGYLPPESVPPFADEPPAPPPSVVNNYLPPVSQDIPLADEPLFPEQPQPPQVVGEYLPPNIPPQRDEVFVVPPAPAAEQGYNYNAPTTTSTSTFAPLGDEGFEEPNDSDNSGYRYDPPANIYIPPSGVGRSLRDDATNQRTPIRLQLNELACLRNGGGYFRAALTVQSALDSVPLVDVENELGGGCEVRLDQSRLLVDIAWPDFGRCGVTPCGQPARELCLRVRFPAIAGMRTVSDPVLTLQCRIQQRIVARTHSVRLGVADDGQGRGAGDGGAGTAFAVGGSQRPFRSQLGIFRRQNGAGGGGGSFTRALQPGGAVMLGEELMLRTQVSAGDGWNFTRLSEVVMQRLSPTGTVLNSASLVNANGCLNPLMRAISPVAPVFEAPLGYRLGFRAAMFQGMRSGDEMVLRVRIVGCVDRRECLVENCQTTVRSKRDTEPPAAEGHETNDTTPDSSTTPPPLAETASIAFRIMLPPEEASSSDAQDNPASFLSTPHALLWITVGTTTAVVLAIGLLALVLVALRHRRRPSYDEYRSD
uniref:ZP domain-containing protein n=1 Tax=Anopheles dirus TaxID=7168 RepID=A0A182MXT1_9DIPT